MDESNDEMGATQSRAAKDAHNRVENAKMDSGEKQRKTESEMKSSGAMQWSSQSPHMSPRNAVRGMAM